MKITQEVRNFARANFPLNGRRISQSLLERRSKLPEMSKRFVDGSGELYHKASAG